MKTTRQAEEEYGKAYAYLTTVETETAQLVFCERFDEKSHIWNFNRHSHDFTEFIYILDGSMQIDVPDKKLVKRFYDLVVYPKNVPHQEVINIQEHQQIICIGIATSEKCELETALEIDDRDGTFRWLMEQIYREHESRDIGYEQVIRNHISTLYVLMCRYFADSRTRQHDFVSRCICYIHDHILENLTIEQLSAVTYVSPSHLTRTFRKRTGYSPLAYIRACRLNIALHELISTKDSIEEVAIRSGFHDAKYFSRFFKAETGMTPREFRRRNANDQDEDLEEEEENP